MSQPPPTDRPSDASPPTEPAQPAIRSAESSPTQSPSRAGTQPALPVRRPTVIAPPADDEIAGTAWPSGFGRYKFGQELGRGGMGSVRLAVDPAFHREMAVKRLLDPTDQIAREAFIEEAQITGQLEHPNIIPVHDLGTDTLGRPFLTMKRVQGQTLHNLLESRVTGARHTWRHDETHLLAIFVKIGEAIAYAHSRGVIHRDLRPENIMLGEFGEGLVMDWGLAKPLGGDDLRRAPVQSDRRADPSVEVTMAGDIFGTPAFMPPEQAAGDTAAMDERVDIFALGGILYAMLTLQRPYVGNDTIAVINQARQGKIIAPTQRAKHRQIPRDLEAIAMKALAHRPDDRYRRVRDLLGDIVAYQAHARLIARQDSLLSAAIKWTRRHPRATLSGVFSLVGALLVSIVAMVLIARAEQAERDRQVAAEREAAANAQAISARKIAASEAALRQQAEETAAFKSQLVDAMKADDFAHVLDLLGEKITFQRDNVLDEFLARYQASMNSEIDRDVLLKSLTPEEVAAYVNAFEALFAAARKGFIEVTAEDHFHYAMVLYGAKGDYLAAVEQMNHAIARNPELPNAYLNRATIYFALKQFDSAIRDCELVLEKFESPKIRAAAYFKIGNCKREMRDATGALEFFTKSIELDDTNASAYYLRGTIKHRNGNTRGAMRDYDNAIRVDPNHARALAERGHLHFRAGNLDQAKSDLDRAIAVQPDYPEALQNRGLVHVERKAWQHALDDFSAALRFDPNFPGTWVNRGQVKDILGDEAGALADFEKALTLDAHWWPAMASMGVMLRNSDRPRAIALLTRAIELCDQPRAKTQLERLLEQLRQ